MKTQTHTV